MGVRLSELKIGQRVFDHATKSTGVITARADSISGYSQFVVQLEEKDGKIPEAYALDWQSFEILDDALVENTIKPVSHSYNLGDRVRSLDTGIKGVIVRLWTYVNGCVHAAISLPATKQGEAQHNYEVPINRLELIKAAAEPVKKTKRAGPPTRMGG